ncbi:MAG: DoxX family protein [Pseudarcicella sp.]|nr:DoxX family protein [Pseudarcicella sp.]MBP6410870.1 DoxX family protein [Pseudarcicella sp.]
MKAIAQFSRIFVGIIFTFSGLIKLKDPVGTQIKLEEYFDVFSQDFAWSAGFWHAITPFALYFAIFLCTLEVVLGVALLVSYKLKTTSWILLITCIFFGFLTFYSAYFNKVTDCGCFGETIKLKPWTSFWKDIILLFFILIILWKRQLFTERKTGSVVTLTVVLCLLLGIYCVRYLTVYDDLPYAVGQNIPTNMKPSEQMIFKYTYEKDGKEVELDQMPTDTTYHFKAMVTVNEDAAKPKITDYNLWKDGDTTNYKEESFKGKKLMIVISSIEKANTANIASIQELAKSLEKTDVKVWLVSASSEEAVSQFRHEHQLGIINLSADAKILKTIVRSNPGIWLLKEGTVVGKWSSYCTPSKDDVLAKTN